MLGALRNFAVSFDPLRKALADRSYRNFAAANLLAFIGVWMQRLIFGWLVWDFTHSALWVGLLAVCDFAPALLLGPIGGVLGDRVDQARLILVCQLAFLMSGLAAGVAVAVGAGQAWLLLFFALIAGSASTLSDAARLGIIRRIVRPDAFAASIAISGICFNVARFAGPALGGAALLIIGPGASLMAAALMGAPFAFVLHRQDRLPAQSTSGATWVRGLFDGAAYAFSHRSIGGALLLFALTCLLVRPAYELMPGLAARLWGGGPVLLSTLVAAIGAGALVGALWLSRRGVSPEPVVLRGVVGSALSLIAFVLAPWTELAIGLAAMLGYFISTAANGALILAQTEADPAYQARVASLWAIIVRAGPAIGALLIGGSADRLGFRGPILVCAVLCFLAAIAFRSALRRPKG